MAIPKFKDALVNSMSLRRTFVQAVRQRHGIQPDREYRIEVREAFSAVRDPFDEDEVLIEFDRPKQALPLNVAGLLDRIAEKLHDPFRGPVVQAAVPELHADLVALLTALEKLDKPYRVAMKLSAAQQLME